MADLPEEIDLEMIKKLWVIRRSSLIGMIAF